MSSSFFSEYEDHLDPKLFGQGSVVLRGTVRAELLSHLYAVLDRHFKGARSWSRAWIAGSGVSFQWSAARDPGDLDVLVGVRYEIFRHQNPDYRQLSDVEISRQINEIFRQELQPQTEDWHGFEVTFYVNPNSWDITQIKPYAAYSLTDNEWTVTPRAERPAIPAEWETQAADTARMAQLVIRRYSDAHTHLMNAPHDTARRNAEQAMKGTLAQASAMFDQVHEGRKMAFGPMGQGYGDRHNFLWQAGKRDGWLPALKEMKQYYDDMQKKEALDTYGVEMPDTNTLIRRAAVSYATMQLD